MKQIRYRIELSELMRELGLPMIAAEIGCAEGLNAKDLLTNGIEKLYMVDAWKNLNQSGDGANPQSWHDKNYSDAMLRVQNFLSKVVVLRGMSVDMARHVPDNSLGMVYIDCDHSYQGVMADLQAWTPKVVNGGIIAGHDYLNTTYGVFKAVEDFTNGKFKVYKTLENKDEDAGFYFLNK